MIAVYIEKPRVVKAILAEKGGVTKAFHVVPSRTVKKCHGVESFLTLIALIRTTRERCSHLRKSKNERDHKNAAEVGAPTTATLPKRRALVEGNESTAREQQTCI